MCSEARKTVAPTFKGPRECFWIVGEPGAGKSRYVKEFGPFIKASNKWWDGYNQETDVLIDDLELDAKYLGHFLKLWGDPWGYLVGEVKGAHLALNFNRLWITSNYTIDQVFGGAPGGVELVAAIRRRFVEIRVAHPAETRNFPDRPTWELL